MNIALVYKIVASLFGSIFRIKSPLVLDDFEIESKVPDCISLSSNKIAALQIDVNALDITMSEDYSGLESDFVNDFFIHNNLWEQHTFCCTKLTDASNAKNAVYIPGNNDYFYNAEMARALKRQGYNFYAISFPHFGFASNVRDPEYSNFNDIGALFQYIDIVVQHYNLDKIDILFGHSTGGLIATMYAEHKNKRSAFVGRLVLSSPFFDWYGDPNSFFLSEWFAVNVVAPLGLIFPRVNVKMSKGAPNLTSRCEFNERNFNPNYKSLTEIHTYPEWVRAVTVAQQRVQGGQVDVRCRADIFHSDKSVFWEYTETADNVLDVNDIKKYGAMISSNVAFHEIENSTHNCFSRIEIADYL